MRGYNITAMVLAVVLGLISGCLLSPQPEPPDNRPDGGDDAWSEADSDADTDTDVDMDVDADIDADADSAIDEDGSPTCWDPNTGERCHYDDLAGCVCDGDGGGECITIVLEGEVYFDPYEVWGPAEDSPIDFGDEDE